MAKLHIHYGALADPLEEQLNRQGFTLGENLGRTEKLQQALTMCMFHLLTDAQYKSCLNKFHKKVMESVKPLEEVKTDARMERFNS